MSIRNGIAGWYVGSPQGTVIMCEDKAEAEVAYKPRCGHVMRPCWIHDDAHGRKYWKIRIPTQEMEGRDAQV